MVPTASTQRLTLVMHTCKIRTEDFLDVATSARLSVVVLDLFPRTGTSYWLLLLWSLLLRGWIDWCDAWSARPSQYATSYYE